MKVTYPTTAAVIVVHNELLRQFGGAPGLRDFGLLDSALQRPRNLASYSAEADVAALAATLCVGLAKNHPFIDGNKRTALVTTITFLELAGFTLNASNEEAFEFAVSVASSAIDEFVAAEWIRSRLPPNNSLVSKKPSTPRP